MMSARYRRLSGLPALTRTPETWNDILAIDSAVFAEHGQIYTAVCGNLPPSLDTSHTHAFHYRMYEDPGHTDQM